MTSKPILCLSFDGVVHSYTSGWQGLDVIPDPPVPGLFEFLEKAVQVFEIHIFSSRSVDLHGLNAMKTWFEHHLQQWRHNTGSLSEISVRFALAKPKAMVTLDYRALTFNGTWPDVAVLRNFRSWNEK